MINFIYSVFGGQRITFCCSIFITTIAFYRISVAPIVDLKAIVKDVK